MKRRYATALAALGAICVGMGGCSNPGNDITLQGSGATFPAPIYKRWFLEYYKEHPEARVNYTPIGSGAGIRQFSVKENAFGGKAELVQFAASDAGISKEQQEKVPDYFGGVVVVPMTAGSIVLSYNLPEVSKPIRLSREAYVKIFLHQITQWNEAEIARSNPGVNLPDRPITIVRRADSSGTSYAFSNHMSAVAKAVEIEWTPGVGASPQWPKATIAAQGNDGVAALIQLTPGAIGYLEFGFADLAHLPMATLENHQHEYIAPNGESGRKALQGAKIPDDLQIKIPDPNNNAEAYPIVTYTWIICRKHYDTALKADTIKAVLRFCLEDRQQETAEKLGCLRLPKDVIDKARAALELITIAP
jgi:phosphate transport system substrate-binding protein